jgi:hypothetical protein
VAIVVLAVIGAVAGSEYNLLGTIDLPRIPIDEGDLTTGGIIALVVLVITTLLAAIGGGKAGERYHRRVDEAGLVAEEPVVEERTVRTEPTVTTDRVGRDPARTA